MWTTLSQQLELEPPTPMHESAYQGCGQRIATFPTQAHACPTFRTKLKPVRNQSFCCTCRRRPYKFDGQWAVRLRERACPISAKMFLHTSNQRFRFDDTDIPIILIVSMLAPTLQNVNAKREIQIFRQPHVRQVATTTCALCGDCGRRENMSGHTNYC